MKIMWFSNIIFSEFAETLGMSKQCFGGWMIEFRNGIERTNNQLIICSFDTSIKEIVKKEINGIKYILIPKNGKDNIQYDKSLYKKVTDVIKNENPDIVHVWGTEYPYVFSITKAVESLNIPTVYSLQGLISDLARHYNNGIPFLDRFKFTFRDFLKWDNLYLQQKRFKYRGSFEEKSLQIAKNVIGRTIYDYSCAKSINKKINYYFCNECLRNSFYNMSWDIDNMEKETIFISQANYPIKGFHYFLSALKIVKVSFPNVKVFVAGGFDPYKKKLNIKENGYERLIKRIINKYNLKENIVFLGTLSEEEMAARMSKSNVFVSPSLIENSPNSVGEAMLMGVPVVSSFVGGVGDMICHKKEGLLYPHDQPSILASYIMDIFTDSYLAMDISKNGKEKAKLMFDINKNVEDMLTIYEKVRISQNN